MTGQADSLKRPKVVPRDTAGCAQHLKGMRRPGIEPGSTAWKAAMLTIIPPTPLSYWDIFFYLSITALSQQKAFYCISSVHLSPSILNLNSADLNLFFWISNNEDQNDGIRALQTTLHFWFSFWVIYDAVHCKYSLRN